MSVSTSLLAYGDCLSLLDKALSDPVGGRLRCSTIAEATFLRMRCHQARKLDRERNREIYENPRDPKHGTSVYDRLVLRIREVEDEVFLYMERCDIQIDGVEPLSAVAMIPFEPMKQIEHQPEAEVEIQDPPRVEPTVRRRV